MQIKRNIIRWVVVPLIIVGIVAWYFFNEDNETQRVFGATTTVTEGFNTDATWTAPTGITSVTAKLWGGGGEGGSGDGSSYSGGGGGGGAFSIKAGITVSPGTGYTVDIGLGGSGAAAGHVDGNDGADTSFINSSTVLAKGGQGGDSHSGTAVPGGPGGASASCVGDTAYSGGGGGTAYETEGWGGGGGGGAGDANVGGAGGNATISAHGTAGVGGIAGGGDGRAGADGSPAKAFTPGGGGGGVGYNNASGGDAGDGQALISYTATAPYFVGAGAQVVTSTAGATIVPAVPTGTQENDVMLLVLGGRMGGINPASSTVSSGWTYRSAYYRDVGAVDLQVQLWYALATSTPSSPIVTPSSDYLGGAAGGMSAQLITFRNVDTTSIFDVASDSLSSAAAAATWQAPSITTNTEFALPISIVATADDNALGTSTPEGFFVTVGGASYDTTTGSDHAVGVAYAWKGVAGAKTMITWAETAVGNDAWVGISTALKPLSSTPAAPTPPNPRAIIKGSNLIINGANVILK